VTEPTTAGPSRARGGATAVAAAMAAANALGYGLNLVASRQLGPAGYGALAALLGLVLIGNVVALALQAVVARHAAAAGGDPAAVGWATSLGWRCGAAVLVLSLLAAPVVTAGLHLGSPLPAVWLALALAPLTLVGAQLGVLQGTERFTPLAVLYLVAAAGKVGGGLVGVLVLGSVNGAMLGTAVGSLVAAAVGDRLLRPVVVGSRTARAVPSRVARETAHAANALGALFALTNVDVVLARHFLSAHDAGLYAVGSVVAKAAFWLPSFVPVIALPGLADPVRRRATAARALTVVTATAVVMTVATAVCGSLVVAAIGGAAYAELAGSAWLYAAAGSALGVAQVLLYSRLATDDRRVIIPMWLLVLLEVLVIGVSQHDSPTHVVTVVLAAAAALAVAGTLAEAHEHDVLRRRRPEPSDERGTARV
jgi:hypothetical protein